MKQEYELGKFLKDRYVTELLNSSYLFKEVDILFWNIWSFTILNTILAKMHGTLSHFSRKKVFQFTSLFLWTVLDVIVKYVSQNNVLKQLQQRLGGAGERSLY